MGSVLAMRIGDRIAAFLAQWVVLMLVLSAGFGALGTGGFALYQGPLAILAGMAIARVNPVAAASRVSAGGWAAIAATLTLLGVAILIIGTSIGGGRSLTALAWIGLVAVLAIGGHLWVRTVKPDDRRASVITLASILFLSATVATIMRASFGGSPPGTEPLTPVQTHPAFREAFEELYVLARADATRVIVYNESTPIVARWYGRGIPQVSERSGVPVGAIAFRTAPPPSPLGQTPLTREALRRVPLQTVAQLEPTGLHALGIARWAVSRAGVVQGRGQDIIIVR
jgi:hypothetical protein